MAKEMNMEALQANLRMIDKKSEMARNAGTITPEQEKANALLNDAAFIQKFLESETAEEAQNLFRENGLEISLEELNGLGAYIASVSKKLIENGGEISEEELEQIAGGSLIDDFLDYTKNLTDGEATGAGIGTTVGSVGGVLGGIIGGSKLGAVIGTCICPVTGTAMGAAVGTAVGTLVGVAGGSVGGFFGGSGLVKGVKKLGSWISSWF